MYIFCIHQEHFFKHIFLCLLFLQKQLAHNELISSSRPTVGRQDPISPQWADRGQSARCRPTETQTACCGPTRPSRLAAGRRCIIFEFFLSSVIFMKINTKNARPGMAQPACVLVVQKYWPTRTIPFVINGGITHILLPPY